MSFEDSGLDNVVSRYLLYHREDPLRFFGEIALMLVDTGLN